MEELTRNVTRVAAVLHEGMYQPETGHPCWHTPEDAARALGVSVSTVRRVARAAGVKKIRGGAVAGMVELYHESLDSVTRSGYMPYAE